MPRSLPVRLSDVADGRNNNFDVLRLVAAIMVLVSHAFPLTDAVEPLARIGGPTLGGLGVALFFAMSGLLITKSWTWDPHFASFATKRARRILPALWVASAVTALALGPLVTNRGLVEYLTNSQPWTYLIRCMAVITFDGRLPGVFLDNPYPAAVNGSLWTLPIEVGAYGLVALLGVGGLLTGKRVVSGLLVVGAVGAVVLQSSVLAAPVNLLAYFMAGIALYRFRRRIVLSWWFAAGALTSWILAFDSTVLPAVGVLALPYVTMVIAYRTPAALRRVSSLGDVSYGLYVYAFPIQQTVMYVIPTAGPIINIAIAAPLAWFAGLLSWRFIEKPALAYRRSREPRVT